jgi:hypothetical protein
MPRSRKRLIVALSVALVLAAAAAVTLLVVLWPRPDPTQPALAACEEKFRNDIQTPSTARFSGATVMATVSNGYRFGIDVDYQNLSGAMIRTHFHCEAVNTGAGWRAELNTF